MDTESEKKKLICEIFGTDDSEESCQSLQKVEYNIHNHRVLQIFDNLIKCMGLIFCLADMLKNQDLITAYFDYHDKEEILMFCQMLMDDFIGVLHDGKALHSLQLSKVFEKLIKSELRNEVPEYINYIPLESKDLYKNMKALKKLANNRLKLTAAKEMAKEKVLHKIYSSNIKNQEKINVLQEKIDQHELQFKDILLEKYAKVERLKREIGILKQENKDQIAKHIYESDKIMLNHCKESDNKQKNLRDSVETSNGKYQRTLDQNLRTEKQLRERKVKVTQQLQQWISKYDADVGIRTKVFEKLTKKLNEEEAAFKKWLEEDFDPQEKNYNFLMEEKEEEERRVHQEKLWMFMMNRAAKLIQKYWRAMVLRKKTKKGRKGRKSKK
uniref:Dynein regulatory complex protein 10 n=1 Tax=Culicoides sonorensis TaxID=179676 RepID=A0A336KMG9_CULSO